MAAFDHLHELADEAFAFRSVETGCSPAMTRRTGGDSLDKQGIGIAVFVHLLYCQEIAAGLTLGPETLL